MFTNSESLFPVANRICIFFSTVYPYETTLDKEFEVLSGEFDRIYYFPSNINNSGSMPDLPANVELRTELALFKERILFTTFKHFFSIIHIYLQVLLERQLNSKEYLKNWRKYIKKLLLSFRKKDILVSLLNDNQEWSRAIFSDYWFENTTMALALLKESGKIKYAISRAHGFDLYDDRWGENGIVPFRNFKMKYLDSVYCISKYGQEYMRSKIPSHLKKKVRMSYLGTKEWRDQMLINDSDEKLIVSCSNTQGFKRVHLIPDMLQHFTIPVKWVHFGTGPMDDFIRSKIKSLPANVRAELKGRVDNQEIMRYYGENHVDFFLSLSMNEGLPISMMEAISFGIPVAGMNIKGIPEIVNEETGILLDPSASLFVIAKELESKIIMCQYRREMIREFWNRNFNYKKNYKQFIKMVRSDCSNKNHS